MYLRIGRRVMNAWLTCELVCAQDYPMLLGNLVAILVSALIVVVVTLIKPDNYDWKTTREIAMVDDAETGAQNTLPCQHA